MDTIKYLVPKGTIKRIKASNAIGVKELELKPFTFVAIAEDKLEIIHAKSIYGIALDLDAVELGWIRWVEGNPEPQLSTTDLHTFWANQLQATQAAQARAAMQNVLYGSITVPPNSLSEMAEMEARLSLEKLDRSLTAPPLSTNSDAKDALGFFAKMRNKLKP
ncbi:hypothetical protein ACUND2_22545 [Serratia sp. IR-2025]